jgi:hypothetical protein
MRNGKRSVPIAPATHRVLTMLSGKTNRSEEDSSVRPWSTSTRNIGSWRALKPGQNRG